MILYIVRHAIAAPHGTSGVPDDERPLTEEGIKKMRETAAGLRCLNYIPELILSSPLIRARQTADILHDVLGKGIGVEIFPALAPGGSRPALYRSMASYSKKIKNLMIVGHQPSLGEIAGDLVFGSPEHYIELKKGGVCIIEITEMSNVPKGSLISLLTPSVLRKIVP